MIRKRKKETGYKKRNNFMTNLKEKQKYLEMRRDGDGFGKGV